MAETPTLRPLAVGEVLDAGVKLYLRHWKPLAICVVGIVLPLEILSVLLASSVDTTLDFDFRTTTSGGTTYDSDGAAFAVEVLTLLGILLANASCFKAVADAWLGSEPSAKRSLGFALRRLPSLLWLAVIAICALVLAFIALVIPFIWLAVAWSLCVPALLFERLGGVKALGRSFRLVQGRWWPMLGALLCAYLLAGYIALLVVLLPSELANWIAPDNDLVTAIAAVIGGTLSQVITTPYLAAVITLLYFDQRVRKEAFDLQLLAEAAAPPAWWRDPVPAGPGLYGAGFGAPGSDPHQRRPPPAEAAEPDGRTEWLPPEAPRGPGGP